MPADDVERRLAAILSADVAGYSRLMAEDEQTTVRTITAYRNEIGNLVADHRGRLVDATGDNALAEFPTAIGAVECAVEIQKVLKVRNERLHDDRRMEFRIGVHLGDVTVERERIYGDGVNIAARLQGLAEPSGICISFAVHEQVRRKIDVTWEDLGVQSVKNIPDGVQVFRLLDEAPTVGKVTTAATADGPSIVVLPFVNMSADPDQEYFCDGMAEEVINALTQLEGLHVVARTSAFSFKGRDVDVREIGSKLGVRSVLEGSVRRAGERLRVIAQLVDVESGYHLWSERFDRQLDDIFAIQDEIATSIAAALKLKLAAVGVARGQARASIRDAYDLYLRGLHYRWLQTEEGLKKGLESLRRSLELDPQFAAAQVLLAEIWMLLGAYGLADSRIVLREGEAAALRSLELDSSLARGHMVLGGFRGAIAWDWEGAKEAFRRGQELGDTAGSLIYAWYYLLPTGQTGEAVLEAQRSHETDPLQLIMNHALGDALFFDRQYEEAIRQYRQTATIFPDFTETRLHLAAALLSLGDTKQALLEYQQIFRRSTEPVAAAGELQMAFTDAGEQGMLRWWIERELPQAREDPGDSGSRNRAVEIAVLYARVGDHDGAFEWLSESLRRRESRLPRLLMVHPWFDDLRSDARHRDMLEAVGLVELS